MTYILGIETSCDETGVAVFDQERRLLRSSALFSQIDDHKKYGGVVPEIASRSQLEKIDVVVAEALERAGVTLADIDAVAVTNRPGLMGSLLIGVCFAKGLAWAGRKKIIGVHHIEGHVFSSFLTEQEAVNSSLPFPHLCLSVSGGHTALYIVRDFGNFEKIAHTIDDAAGEAFDKTARLLGLGYPGGPAIERLAASVGNEDFFSYPRNINKKNLNVSFSGLKTAVLYDLVKRGAFDMEHGVIASAMTDTLKAQVASSLQVCIADIFCDRLRRAFKEHPDVKACTFVGGVACNGYMRSRIEGLCARRGIMFVAAPKKYCGDNGAMIALVGGYKYAQAKFSDLTLDATSN